MNPMYNEREGEYSIKKKTCRQECTHADSEALCVRGVVLEERGVCILSSVWQSE